MDEICCLGVQILGPKKSVPLYTNVYKLLRSQLQAILTRGLNTAIKFFEKWGGVVKGKFNTHNKSSFFFTHNKITAFHIPTLLKRRKIKMPYLVKSSFVTPF